MIYHNESTWVETIERASAFASNNSKGVLTSVDEDNSVRRIGCFSDNECAASLAHMEPSVDLGHMGIALISMNRQN